MNIVKPCLQWGFWALIWLLNMPTSSAQSLAKIKENGLIAFSKEQYKEAFPLLKTYLDQKEGDKEVQTALGIAAYHINKLDAAQQYLMDLVETQKAVSPNAYFYLAKTFHARFDFKGAAKYYKKFLANVKPTDPERRRVIAELKRCETGLKLPLKADAPLVENMGPAVNSTADEFAPVLSPNFEERVYFSANKPDAEGGLRNKEGLEDAVNGHFFTDIYFTELEEGDWLSPERIDNALINSGRHERLLDITNAGKTLVFFRSLNNFSGDILIDTFKTDVETRSLPPQFTSPVMPENGDYALHFFNDSILLFASQRAGGLGGYDLYYTVFNNGAWSVPVNFGAPINSAYDETTPFLAKDGRTLYFSSNSTASMGGFDVFKSSFIPSKKTWDVPQNLGRPINSAQDDAYFRLAPDGVTGYFSSNRKEGLGERDLYSVLFKSMQKEQTPSVPLCFYLIDAEKTADMANNGANEPTAKTEAVVSPIYYDTDDDILLGTNLREVRQILKYALQFPNLKVILTGHCLEGEKTSFDLYFTLKKIEKVAQYLQDNGLARDRIFVKSVGSEYPIALTFLDGKQSIAGEKLNKRIDIQWIINDVPEINVSYNPPSVSSFLVNPAGERLQPHVDSLTYKVQITTSRRLFDHEILSKIGDAMAESIGTEGIYQYTVGLVGNFAEAENLRQQVVAEGFKDAFIVPYVKGQRLFGDDVKKWTNTYPDLILFLANKK